MPKTKPKQGAGLEARARYQSLRLRLLRAIPRAADRISDRIRRWCKRRMKPENALPPARGTLHSWQSIITVLGNQELIRALLDGGVFGYDLPRTSGIPQGDRILVLAAHQDDEIIAAGGTFVLCAEAKKSFHSVYLTDGATPFGNLTLEEATQVRAAEARRVWNTLANVEPLFMGYANRGGDTLPEDAPRRLAEVIDKFKPTTIFVPTFLESPIDHRKMNRLLLATHRLHPLDATTEVWGYQITTRVPGNVAVDITDVWKKKHRLNQMWRSQNAYLDYAHLAMGQDIANSIYLKRLESPRPRAAHAEIFVVFPAPEYMRLCELFFDTADALLTGNGTPTAPPPPDFLIVGMQKSGTFWLTALLNGHPEIRCFPSIPGGEDGSGEAHLFDLLARMESEAPHVKQVFKKKLNGYFKDLAPEAPPRDDPERERLYGAFRRRFNQYCETERRTHGKRLVGEKTTETVHHLDIVDRMYPEIKKICILRDPRDRVVSFHFHQVRKKRKPAGAEISREFIDDYMEQVRKDYEGLLQIREPVFVLTYEQLSSDPGPAVSKLLEFLGAGKDEAVIDTVLRASSFENLSSRPPGVEDAASHYRRGVVGDWREKLTAEQSRSIVGALEELTGKLEHRFEVDLSAYQSE